MADNENYYSITKVEKSLNSQSQSPVTSPRHFETDSSLNSVKFELFFESSQQLLLKEEVDSDDLWPLNRANTLNFYWRQFEQYWKEEKNKPKPSLTSATLRFSKRSYIISLLFYIVHVFLCWTPVILLPFFVTYVADPTQDWCYGILYVILGFLGTVLCILTYNHAIYISFNEGIKLSCIYRHALYTKCLKLPKLDSGKIGDVINLFSGQNSLIPVWLTDFLQLSGGFLHFIVSTLILAHFIGWYSLIPIATIFLSIPFALILIFFYIKFDDSKRSMANGRIKLISELFQAIRIVKFYSWENPFLSRIDQERNSELRILFKKSMLRSGVFFIISNAPIMGLGLTFLFYGIYAKHNVTVIISFILVAVVNVVKQPFLQTCEGLLNSGSLLNIINRIEAILLLPEKKNSVNYAPSSVASGRVTMKGCTFQWPDVISNISEIESSERKINMSLDTKKEPLIELNEASQHATLTNIDLTVSTGEKVMIVGQVGSGKSSLILGILGEVPLLSGSISVEGDIAYVSQEAWIFNATVRENIIFGNPFVQEQYQKILTVVSLHDDLKEFPAGDMSEIGERGINLSGGQKQRISLARALYANRQIYILDNPLSALDTHVSNHVFQKVFLEFLKNKTVIMACNQLKYLPHSDKIVLLKDGQIITQGTFQQLKKESKYFSDLVTLFEVSDKQQQQQRILLDEVDDISAKEESSEQLQMRKHKGLLIQKEEDDIKGAVPVAVFWYLVKNGGVFTAFIIIFLCVFASILQVGSTWWLGKWANSDNEYMDALDFYKSKLDTVLNFTSYDITDYPNITFGNETFFLPIDYYGPEYWPISTLVWILTSSACILVVCFLLMSGFAITASKNIHRQILYVVASGSVRFFDTTPIGRIIQRFTISMDELDLLIPSNVTAVIYSLYNIFGVVAGIYIGSWYLCLLFIPFLVLFFLVEFYIKVKGVKLQRLVSLSRAPILSNLTSTLSGVETIRSFNNEKYCNIMNEKLSDQNSRETIALQYFNAWYSILVGIIASVAYLFVLSGIVVIRNYFPHLLNDVGTAIMLSFTANFSTILTHCIVSTAYLSTRMTSVEKIYRFLQIEQENIAFGKTGDTESSDWVSDGEIEFSNFSFKYGDGPVILKNLNFVIPARSKIGIVGRTGAGKSSLLQVLYRFSDPTEGTILIDKKDIKSVPLSELRSCLAIIPQDPTLFIGTLRYNLDPFQQYSDAEIWRALETVQLKSLVESHHLKLECPCEVNGSNFSVGQRQLLCMARAILKKSKIIMLDEATASVDVETATIIHKTLLNSFSDVTVITIAHRIESVMLSDKILVLEKGTVVEYDSPQKLLQNVNGRFYSLYQATKHSST